MNRDDVLREAIGRIDPGCLLERDSKDARRISKMISGWIDKYGEEAALRMAERSQRYLIAWRRAGRKNPLKD